MSLLRAVDVAEDVTEAVRLVESGVEEREVEVHGRQLDADDRRARRDHLVADDAAVEEVVEEAVHREGMPRD